LRKIPKIARFTSRAEKGKFQNSLYITPYITIHRKIHKNRKAKGKQQGTENKGRHNNNYNKQLYYN
jgi:hypothetical protein